MAAVRLQPVFLCGLGMQTKPVELILRRAAGEPGCGVTGTVVLQVAHPLWL